MRILECGHGVHFHQSSHSRVKPPKITQKFSCRASSSGSEALRALKPSGPKFTAGGAADPEYTAASDYLKTIGFTNIAEISRVLDIATNPNSVLMGKTKNAHARSLDVEKDIMPVVTFLQEKGVKVGDVYKVIIGHPPVICYSIQHLKSFWEYFESLSITNVGDVIAKRPNLLGLNVDKNLRKIVEYLQYVETPPETIIKYLTDSI
ncbi:hypothetical protein CEUSTIGMA_g250.t1 [Chlamydomonas eustigma]|uniref:Mitochondrial transcription termination factor family protein n=1 Tax=Chlamydomonas eustigma TaxID=1157962 RepID=A0A250WPM3_9CHLO|nr:hypothetical protein CEUSTIGMA_g250.t1 [Chlamydomonas eustigma]|eukprot:GAX72795.1 hypothetical protein CEUSTIGMA_g250.t1 [Chlamydomonas eustigma]